MIVVEQLKTAKQMFDAGKREILVRQKLGTPLGAAMYALCRLDEHFPALNIVARCLASKTAEDHIPLNKVSYSTVRSFLFRLDVGLRRKQGKELCEKELQQKPLTQEEVDDYFDYISAT